MMKDSRSAPMSILSLQMVVTIVDLRYQYRKSYSQRKSSLLCKENINYKELFSLKKDYY